MRPPKPRRKAPLAQAAAGAAALGLGVALAFTLYSIVPVGSILAFNQVTKYVHSGTERAPDRIYPAVGCNLQDAFGAPRPEDIDIWANLEEDFRPWREKGFTRADLEQLAADFPEHDSHSLIRIENNKLNFTRRPSENFVCTNPSQVGCNRFMDGFVWGLEQAIEAGEITLPNTTFLLNVNDLSLCKGPGSCAAPMFTLFKAKGDDGILVPELSADAVHSPQDPRHRYRPISEEAINTPWEDKEPRAFFRGANYCIPKIGVHRIGDHDLTNCSRNMLMNVSLSHPHLVDVWSFDYTRTGDNPNKGGNPASYVAMQDWPKYKYLLSLDGISASFRQYKMLLTNSLVLKQESRWLQWYYRSLKPCVHYLPIYHRHEEDIVEVMELLQTREGDAAARQMALNAQAFALRYLTRKPRLEYLKRALERYASLLRD